MVKKSITKFKMSCKVCKKEVSEISIYIKNFTFRSDFVLNYDGLNDIDNYNNLRGNDLNSSTLVLQDAEYFSGTVNKIIFNCGCGEISINNEQSDNLNDFIRQGGFIFLDDLKEKEYGNLIINEREVCNGRRG